MALFLGQHQTENENFGVDWVIHYEFDGVGMDKKALACQGAVGTPGEDS